jgi:phage tail-like protein
MSEQSLDSIVEATFGPLDPSAEFRYYVEVDGLVEGSFIECSGMAMKRDVLEVREGGVNSYTHKLPGRTTYGTITLRKGIMFSTGLWEWYAEGLSDCKVRRRNITITQVSSYFNLPARWYTITNAFPESWEVSSLRSDSSQYAVESLTLTFETLKVEKWVMGDLDGKFRESRSNGAA